MLSCYKCGIEMKRQDPNLDPYCPNCTVECSNPSCNYQVLPHFGWYKLKEDTKLFSQKFDFNENILEDGPYCSRCAGMYRESWTERKIREATNQNEWMKK